VNQVIHKPNTYYHDCKWARGIYQISQDTDSLPSICNIFISKSAETTLLVFCEQHAGMRAVQSEKVGTLQKKSEI
jgi:hypothetical protein